jgi:predicted transcriptional regulator
VRLGEEMKIALEREAHQQDRSTSYIARKAIEDHIRYSELERKAIAEAVKDADK